MTTKRPPESEGSDKAPHPIHNDAAPRPAVDDRTGWARQRRYESLRDDLVGAWERYLEALRSAEAAEREDAPRERVQTMRLDALGAFRRELVRVTRADRRLLFHPEASRHIAMSRVDTGFLRQLPKVQVRRIPRPLSRQEQALLDEADRLRQAPREPTVRRGPPSSMTKMIRAIQRERLPVPTPPDAATPAGLATSMRRLNEAVIDAARPGPPPPRRQTKPARGRPARSWRAVYAILVRQHPDLLVGSRAGRVIGYDSFHGLVADGHGKGGEVGTLRF